jgi:hypothetical protein
MIDILYIGNQQNGWAHIFSVSSAYLDHTFHYLNKHIIELIVFIALEHDADNHVLVFALILIFLCFAEQVTCLGFCKWY